MPNEPKLIEDHAFQVSESDIGWNWTTYPCAICRHLRAEHEFYEEPGKGIIPTRTGVDDAVEKAYEDLV